MTLKMVRIIALGMRNLLTKFDVSGTFRSRLMGQHLSDAPRDIVTLTFEVAGDGLSWRYESSYSICTPSLVTLTFAIDLETGAHYCPWGGGQPSYQFWCF